MVFLNREVEQNRTTVLQIRRRTLACTALHVYDRKSIAGLCVSFHALTFCKLQTRFTPCNSRATRGRLSLRNTVARQVQISVATEKSLLASTRRAPAHILQPSSCTESGSFTCSQQQHERDATKVRAQQPHHTVAHLAAPVAGRTQGCSQQPLQQ